MTGRHGAKLPASSYDQANDVMIARLEQAIKNRDTITDADAGLMNSPLSLMVCGNIWGELNKFMNMEESAEIIKENIN